MEEKTLEELNNEYKSLVEKVKQIKIELEKAIAEKEVADGNYERASDDFATKTTTYENLQLGLEKIENSGFSTVLIEGMREEVKAAKEAMEEAERVLEVRKTEQESAREAFTKIENDSKKESGRLDVILVSFGANKIINDAISNEIEIDYSEMIAKKEAERTEIDALKTKINDDSKVQEQVGELDTLLKKFEELKKNVTPENATELAVTGELIKKQRASIRRRMRTLGLKGGKISVEEIDRMTTDKDDQGRIVIAELDRRTEVANNEIINIEEEKQELLGKMKASLEIGTQIESDETEAAKLRKEIEGLNGEKDALEKEQIAINITLDDIEKQKNTLREEQTKLDAARPKTTEVEKLIADKETIEREVVEKIDNPKKAELRNQIAELEAKKVAAGVDTTVETDEYKAANTKFVAAKTALNLEKRVPSVGFTAKTDVIIDNPDYVAKTAELTTVQNELNRITNLIINNNPELKELYDEWLTLKQEEERIVAEYNQALADKIAKEDELTVEYVSEDLYPTLDDSSSQTSNDFRAYKEAELNLRIAMAALQKDPSQENIEAFMSAKDAFSIATQTFQNSLAESVNTRTLPSPKAIHKFLLGKLNDAYINFEEIDEGYDLNQAERRIAILEAQTRRDENGKENIANLRASSKGLEAALNDILVGNVVDDTTLVELIAKHQENINAFADPEAAISTLKGVNLEVADGRFGFLKRIISRFTTPKVEERYKFSENKEPEINEQYESALFRHDELKDELDETQKRIKEVTGAYNTKLKEVATDEQSKSMKENRERVTKLREELKRVPAKINKTKLDRLTAEMQEAEAKLNATPRYHVAADTKDIDDQIEELTGKLNDEPDQIENPEQAASKKRRIAEKEALIEEASMDATEPRRIEIRKLLEGLDSKETDERTKLQGVSGRLTTVLATIKDKVEKLSVYEVARRKAINIIKIKDANRMLDRRSGRIAEDLVNATRPKKEELEER